MPALVLHQQATVQCAHGGQATPTEASPRVQVSGMPVATMGAPWTVAGCALPPPAAGNGPCVTAQWTSGALRVTSLGMPLLLTSGTSTCVPTGTPLLVVDSQTRVTAT
jgi:uncharacterized Zn-binding protein involved in type VI secretion